MVKIILSFATEDFITPAHDHILLRLCRMLSSRNIIGNFHLTGELARRLREHHRDDVIAALSEHELGYHGNTHGAFPFIADICENLPWDQAVATLMATESRGILDMIEIFGHRPRYYVLEFIKAPQLIHAINSLGIDIIGFSTIPGINTPFSYFAGSICFTAPHMGIESPPAPKRLENLKTEFDKHYQHANNGLYDGLFKLFNHPYKLFCNNRISCWCNANPIYRKYDLHQDWQQPAASAMYDQQTIDRLFDEFAAILDHALGKGNVEFVSTSMAADLYRDSTPLFVDLETITELAAAMTSKFTYAQVHNYFFSPAEVFAMLVSIAGFHHRHGKLPNMVPLRRPLGPVTEIPDTPLPAFTPAVHQAGKAAVLMDREISFYRRLPAGFSIGDHDNIPLGCLFRIYTAFLQQIRKNPDLSKIEPTNGPNLPEIADSSYFQANEFTRPIYPEGFTGTNICKHSRLQTWTYKPAKIGSGSKYD